MKFQGSHHWDKKDRREVSPQTSPKIHEIMGPADTKTHTGNLCMANKICMYQNMGRKGKVEDKASGDCLIAASELA